MIRKKHLHALTHKGSADLVMHMLRGRVSFNTLIQYIYQLMYSNKCIKGGAPPFKYILNRG